MAAAGRSVSGTRGLVWHIRQARLSHVPWELFTDESTGGFMASDFLAVPYWTELPGPDPEVAEFYRRLFGWDEPATGPGARSDGWQVFIPVSNVEATVSVVRQEGGTVERTTGSAGRTVTATCLDPRGARFTVCLPDARPAPVGGEHGAFCRAELLCFDRAAAERFYGAVFGWTTDPRVRPDYTYYDWMLGETDIAGLMPLIPPGWRADLSEQWIVYFQVDDYDATACRVCELGGTVEVPRERIPPGWVLVCRDPRGTLFHVIEFASGVPA
jgi:predicted enzyme related to lactoylglutathione lyase